MLTGQNRMQLNQLSMKMAVQHYFDTVLFVKGQSPRVEAVDAEERGLFAITINTPIAEVKGE